MESLITERGGVQCSKSSSPERERESIFETFEKYASFIGENRCALKKKKNYYFCKNDYIDRSKKKKKN